MSNRAWFIPNLYEDRIYGKKKDKSDKYFSVSLCPVCNRAYEREHNQYTKVITIRHYDDFPKYGLYRSTCSDCITDKQNKKGESNNG